jgi:type VI secretion system protein ImpB
VTRNRVQIEYEVEVGDTLNSVELPFVLGVLADLSGQPAAVRVPLADREFLRIDCDNFGSVMTALKPRARFHIPNTLTGADYLTVELTFNNLEDFSPSAVVTTVDALRKLFKTRQQLGNLIARMENRSGSEGHVGGVVPSSQLAFILHEHFKNEADDRKH